MPRHWIRTGIAIATLLLTLMFGFWVRPVLTEEPVTISMLIQALEGAQMANLVESFNRDHADIRLELVEGPNASNLVEDLYASAFLLGDSPYDLVYMDIVWVPKFAAAGWLLDLSDRLSDTELADFMAGDVAGGRYQGGLYRIPLRSDGGMLYYRADLLEQAGFAPPETFTDLTEISQALQSQGRTTWGYVWQGRQYEGLAAMFVEVLAGHGGYWIDVDTNQVGLDDPEAIAAVQFLVDTVDQGIAPPGVTTYQEEETRRIFQGGDAIFLRNWPYVWALANGDDSPVQGKIALQPMVHEPGQSSGACQGGWGLGIAATSQHPEEAWEVVQYLTSAASQKAFVLEQAYVPSRRALFTDPDIVERFPHYPELERVVDSAVLRPPSPQYAQASDILQRYLSAAFTRQLTPAQAMQAAARETRALLGTIEGANLGEGNR